MWQYLMDNDIDSDDWRYDVLSAVFADGTGDMSGIKKYLDDNDWRGFCQYRLDNDIQRAKSGNINTDWTRIFPLTSQTKRKTILS